MLLPSSGLHRRHRDYKEDDFDNMKDFLAKGKNYPRGFFTPPRGRG
jgi:hypothetical protein